MSVGRYSFLGRVNRGTTVATSSISSKIFYAIESGKIGFNTLTLREDQRLDTLAGQVYNDSSLWWVLAAASGIGWGIQVPAGTLIRVPTNLGQIYSLVR